MGVFPFVTTACLDSLAFGIFEGKLEETKVNGFLERRSLARDTMIVAAAALISYPSEVIWRRMVLHGSKGGFR